MSTMATSGFAKLILRTRSSGLPTWPDLEALHLQQPRDALLSSTESSASTTHRRRRASTASSDLQLDLRLRTRPGMFEVLEHSSPALRSGHPWQVIV
jgi:hypothetical protein